MRKEIRYYLILILFTLSTIFSLILIFSRKEQVRKISLFRPISPAAVHPGLPKIARIEISGHIYHSEPSGRFFARDAEYIVSKLKSFGKQKDIKGILIKVNSPGGSVGAVQQIYSQIMKIKNEHKKPVVCYVPEICASGGYYIASAADKIVCSPGAIVGSIGVLIELPNVSGLIKKVGVDMVVIKSSKYKDIGSMFRDILPEEKKILEDLVNTAYEQFITSVAKGRGFDREQVLSFSDGRIFIAEHARRLNIIDEIGDEDTAIEILKNLAGITGDVRIVKDIRPTDFLRTFLGESKTQNLVEKVLNKKFRFEYIFE